MGFHEDLDNAARIALHEMLNWIESLSGLSREDAYTLCSLTADMRITQLVDGNKSVHSVLPNAAL